MADDAKAPEPEEQKSGGMMKTMMMGMGIFIIVLVAQTVAPLIANKLGLAPAPVVMTGDGVAGADTEDAAASPPIYWPLKPALVVNFTGDSGNSFLQVELEVMARDQAVIDAVKAHTPALRNAMLLLLGGQNKETIFTTEGKQALRASAMQELNGFLEPYVDEPGIEAVYFTSFVAQ